MYAVVRTYEMAEEWDDTLLRHLAEDFVPTIEKLAGFVSYHAVQAGERLFCSVTIVENRAGAAESNRLAASTSSAISPIASSPRPRSPAEEWWRQATA